jgi:hypothetical protein
MVGRRRPTSHTPLNLCGRPAAAGLLGRPRPQRPWVAQKWKQAFNNRSPETSTVGLCFLVGAMIQPGSEVVRLLEPSVPVAEARSDCPHHASGLWSWHNAATWPSGVVPAANTNIWLPTGRRVLLSQSPNAVLGVINVPPTAEVRAPQSTPSPTPSPSRRLLPHGRFFGTVCTTLGSHWSVVRSALTVSLDSRRTCIS